MLYTYNRHTGPAFDLHGQTMDAFTTHDSAASAALEMLRCDCQDGGIELLDGEHVPWRKRMDGRKQYLRNLAASSEDAAVRNVIQSGDFDLDCVTRDVAERLIADFADA